MCRFTTLFATIFLLLYNTIAAQDSLIVPDSVKGDIVIKDTVLFDTSLQDSINTIKDSSLSSRKDSLDLDTALSDSSKEDRNIGMENGSVQKDDSISTGSSGELSQFDHSGQNKTIPKNTLLQRELVRKIIRRIKNVISFITRYFLQLFFLLISCGVIIYTIMFFQKKTDDKRFLTSTRLSVMDKQVQIACKYMENHFDDPDLSVETICEDMVTGPAFLEALFDRELGMTVSDFLTHIRINRAKVILEKEPDLSIEELIVRIGYTDVKYFLRHFKEINTVDFKEYQESIKL